MSLPVKRVSFACAVLVFSLASAVPAQHQQPPQEHQEDDTSTSGYGTVLWSVIEDCLSDGAEPATLCFKSKALTAMDRALSKPSVTLVDGFTLSARSGKSLADSHTEQADRAALNAAKDADHKNALLDDMLAARMEKLVATRTISMDSPDAQEGRGKKKKDKTMKQAMMMAGMMAVAVMGPMAMKLIGLIAIKALVLSKIAILLSGVMILKKLMNKQQNQEPEHSVSQSGWGRSLKFDDTAATSASAQKMAFSAHLKQ